MITQSAAVVTEWYFAKVCRLDVTACNRFAKYLSCLHRQQYSGKQKSDDNLNPVVGFVSLPFFSAV